VAPGLVGVADHVVGAGDHASGATGAQAGVDDLRLQLEPLVGPASGLSGDDVGQSHGEILRRSPCKGRTTVSCPAPWATATMGCMDLTYPEEAETFRGEIRAWLEANLPEDWGDREMTAEEKAAFSERWNEKLFEGGWICASWPKEYGGKGLSTMQNVVLNEEFARVGAPMRGDFFGDTLVGPTILQWGTEEQKQHF